MGTSGCGRLLALHASLSLHAAGESVTMTGDELLPAIEATLQAPNRQQCAPALRVRFPAAQCVPSASYDPVAMLPAFITLARL
jgi:hypothetical protein